MSLYGALFAGVSGLNAQSNKIGVISDNIANVNTVGYKGGLGSFGTLVTNSGITAAYSPGGVLSGSNTLISKQGLLQATTSKTDIAIQGAGFFVANTTADGSGQVVFTRAGSFTKDSTGNFINSAGLYLQAWPLDRNGLLPGEAGNVNTTSSSNIASLTTVNVQSLTGSAAATTTLSIGANLKSSQTAYLGASGLVTLDANDPSNRNLKAKDIIVPNTVNSLASGDRFTVSTGTGVTYTYTYGGFSVGRDVTTAPTVSSPTTISGDATTLNNSSATLTNGFATTTTNGEIEVTQTAHGLSTGDWVTISGAPLAGIGGITEAEMEGSFQITVTGANTYTYQTAGTTGSVAQGTATATNEPFKTTAGSRTITVSAPAHGFKTGDSVTFTGFTAALDGVAIGDLNTSFIVTTIPNDPDHYTITLPSTVTAPASGVAGGTGTIVQTANPFTTSSGTSVVSVRQLSHGLKDGDVVTLTGNNADIGGINSTRFNGSFVVDVIDDNHYTITVAAQATSSTGGGDGTISATTRPFFGNVLDANNLTQPFLGVTGTSSFTAASMSFTITNATSGTVKFTYTSASPNSQLGQFNNLTNLAQAINDVNGLSARIVDNKLYVSATDSNEAIAFANVQDTGVEGPPVLAGIDWVGELGLTDVLVGSNRFSTMEGLANIVNNSAGLTATLENPLSAASLKISVKDPLDTITFSDKSITPPLAAFTNPTPFTTVSGSDIVTVTHPAATGFVTGDIVTFDTSLMTGTSYNGIPKANFEGEFVVTVTSPTTYTIRVATEATADGAAGAANLTVTPPNNKGSVLASLGLVPSLASAAYTTPKTTGSLGPAYDPTNPLSNMASGAIPSHFSRPVTIYDGLGTGHNLNVSFLKTGTNTWAVEVFAVPATDLNSTLPNGQLAYGTLTFNGADGTLRSISSTLSAPVSVQWTNGATSSNLTFNWGTAGLPFGTPNAAVIGKSDGIGQSDTDYTSNFAKQNGAPVGQLTGVSIDGDGYIIASYSNNETQKLYRIPLGSFANPDQLESISGNAYVQTSASGEVNLRISGSSGVGTIASASLEASNVELADQLTDMIVAQRAYQANTKVISTADSLLSDLNQILR